MRNANSRFAVLVRAGGYGGESLGEFESFGGLVLQRESPHAAGLVVGVGEVRAAPGNPA